MGSGISRLFPCIDAANKKTTDLIYTSETGLDETLGHSFCYVRSSARFLSPSNSLDRLSPSQSLRLSPTHETTTSTSTALKTRSGFANISGASVSANTSTPRTVLPNDYIYEDATDTTSTTNTTNTNTMMVNGFESTSSFCALPLQPVPRGGLDPIERGGGGFFMSGPIERGALSGPLDASGGGEDGGHVHFSAPLNGIYMKNKRKKKGISGIKKAFYRSLSEKKRPWVVPVFNFVGRKEGGGRNGSDLGEVKSENNVQWALGKAGEDRVHVVVSEEHGWLFVGIYDGFNGPDAPEFLMCNLYRAVFSELEGLFWDAERDSSVIVEKESRDENNGIGIERNGPLTEDRNGDADFSNGQVLDGCTTSNSTSLSCGSVKKVTFQSEQTGVKRKPLWELLAEDDEDDGLDLSGSERFAFSVDDAVRVSNAGSVAKRQSLLLSKLKYGFSKHKEGQGNSRRFFPWRYDWEDKEKTEVDNNRAEEKPDRSLRKRRVGPVDHEMVLRALSRALEVTELAYLDMTDKVLDKNPELALMGSCLLVVLMRDEDVYVMNVGDSRAIVAQYQPEAPNSSAKSTDRDSTRLDLDSIVEESSAARETPAVIQISAQAMKLTALQLSTDHSTSIEEEVLRIKQEHPDDNQCIVNDRVKGRLKVTRAFGAGFLKQPKLNNALLEMFRNEYIGTAPYVSCSPSLCHHVLGSNDQFLVLSSDGLYQYLTNEEVVSLVESFMDKFPEGDPAQHLIEELLFRAAKKAGMDFHELLDIPQGDRRKYHDDVTVMVVSLEGRIWKSSGKYL